MKTVAIRYEPGEVLFAHWEGAVIGPVPVNSIEINWKKGDTKNTIGLKPYYPPYIFYNCGGGRTNACIRSDEAFPTYEAAMADYPKYKEYWENRNAGYSSTPFDIPA